MSSITELNQKTKSEIKNIAKPLSAYQYYTKHFREQWSTMSEDTKDQYLLKAKADNERYANEKQAIMDKSQEEIKKYKIFLARSEGRVPCVGLDNGFSSYEVIGPMHTIELFSEDEKKKLEAKGVSPNDIGKYKSINGIKFNWRAAKKWSVTVYGGNTNNSESWWGVHENYEGYVGKYTRYHSTFDKVWYSPIEADPRPSSDPQAGKTFAELHDSFLL